MLKRSARHNAGVPDSEINQITWQNTCRFFGLDPFKHIARQDAVGALRPPSVESAESVESSP